MDVRAYSFATADDGIVRITTTIVERLVETRVSADGYDDWTEHYLVPNAQVFEDIHAATVAAWRNVYHVPE